MIVNRCGQKRTANELAKELVYEQGGNAKRWVDKFPEGYTDRLTENEKERVMVAIERQRERVAKLFGNPDPTHNKDDDV